MVVNKSMKRVISGLTRLGLTEYEARAYAALLKENPASPYEIAKNSGIPTSKIYEVITRLASREMIQAIQGERSKMYIPLSPDELLQGFRTSMEDTLQAVKRELQGVKSGLDTSGYTWHIREYDNCILRARRMIDTAEESLLLLVWPEEMNALVGALSQADLRGIRTAVVHYGQTDVKMSCLYRHPVEDTIYAERKTRGFTIVADSKEVLTGKIDGPDRTEVIWSMNEGLVMMAEDYIRHDIYFMKLASRFNPLLREKFGLRYEKLRDLYRDESVPDAVR
jgi:sugar-specific transcriptional regulator TrmB